MPRRCRRPTRGRSAPAKAMSSGLNRGTALARDGVVGHEGDIAQAQMLAKAFVIAEEKKFVLLDGAAERRRRSRFAQTGDGALIEEIACVEGAVADKFVEAPCS